jgi:hypothetical protein
LSTLSIEPERHQAQYLWALSESQEQAAAFRRTLTWDQLLSALTSVEADIFVDVKDRDVNSRSILERSYHHAVQRNAATRGPHTPEKGKLAVRLNDEI